MNTWFLSLIQSNKRKKARWINESAINGFKLIKKRKQTFLLPPNTRMIWYEGNQMELGISIFDYPDRKWTYLFSDSYYELNSMVEIHSILVTNFKNKNFMLRLNVEIAKNIQSLI
jgi:hypothetical protein